MKFEIRPYLTTDLDAIYDICLQTSDNGGDDSKLFQDSKLIGQYYVAPYVVLEPELCFVVTNNDKVCGYILGCKDSAHFSQRCEKVWFPALRKQYALPDSSDSSLNALVIKRIHSGIEVRHEYQNYPAHLHINLLPETQGHGIGRKMTEVFINKLKALDVPALHLEVSKTNSAAISFYNKMGFEVIHEFNDSIGFAMVLDNTSNE